MSDHKAHHIRPQALLTWIVMLMLAIGLALPPSQVQAKPDTQVASGYTIYVDSRAPAGGNGISWEKAYNNLQDALNRARCGSLSPNYNCNEIWVARGAYYPMKGVVRPTTIATPHSS